MRSSNILDELANNWMLYTVIILITSHLLMAVLIVANPINQDLEGFFKCPNSECVYLSDMIPARHDTKGERCKFEFFKNFGPPCSGLITV